eukprot:5857066-Amphidinium_carterae.1
MDSSLTPPPGQEPIYYLGMRPAFCMHSTPNLEGSTTCKVEGVNAEALRVMRTHGDHCLVIMQWIQQLIVRSLDSRPVKSAAPETGASGCGKTKNLCTARVKVEIALAELPCTRSVLHFACCQNMSQN